MPVQCSGLPAFSAWSGYRWNQRCPPDSRGRASHARLRACRRPFGNGTRYCCRGYRPKVCVEFELAGLAIGPVSADVEAAIPAEEPAGHCSIGKCSSVETAQHRLLGGGLHRQRVLGLLPTGEFVGVAARTGLGACERRCRQWRYGRRTATEEPPAGQCQEEQRNGPGDNDGPVHDRKSSVLFRHGGRVMAGDEPLRPIPAIGIGVPGVDHGSGSGKGEGVEPGIHRRIAADLQEAQVDLA